MVAYTDRLRLEKQATNTNQNTWGSVLNSNVFDLVDEAVGGVETIALTGANVTLSTANGGTDQARNQALRFTGTGSVTITIPSVEKTYVVQNASNGDVTFSAGGVTAVVASGDGEVIYTDGTDCFACLRISSKIAAAITPVADAGTVKITVDDTTGKYLNSAINVSGLTKTVENAGSAETLLLTSVSDYELISTAEASSSAALVFSGIGTTYSEIMFSIEDLIPTGSSAAMYCNFSSVGTTFGSAVFIDTSAALVGSSTISGLTAVGSAGNFKVEMIAATNPVLKLANSGINGSLTVQAPYSPLWKQGPYSVRYYASGGLNVYMCAMGSYRVQTTGSIRGVQFFPSPGTWQSGTIRMYGKRGV